MQNVRMAGKLGYCFGVSQAIEKAVKFAEENGPLYSLGTLAHNEVVVNELIRHQVHPIKEEDLENGMNVAITAHGTTPVTYEHLKILGGRILDCTCPIVQKAQRVVSTLLDGYDIVIFGDPEHQEVIGLNGWAGGAKFIGEFNDLFTPEQDVKKLDLSKKVAIISQTTKIQSMFADFVTTLVNRCIDELYEVRVFNTICPIVSARVEQTRKLSQAVDMMFVVGSQESANTTNLANVARSGVGSDNVRIVQGSDQVAEALSGESLRFRLQSPKIGVTAGTSTPLEVVKDVVSRLREFLHEY